MSNNKKGILRTFSFEGIMEGGTSNYPQSLPKDSTGAMQIDEKGPKEDSLKGELFPDPNASECLEPRGERKEENKKALEEFKGEAENNVNPFMNGEEVKTPTTFDYSITQQPTPVLDKPPEYLPNRKAYTGSPDFVLTRRQNKMGRFLPKAFTVQMEDSESKEDKFRFLESKPENKTVYLKEKSLLSTPPAKQNTAASQQAQDNYVEILKLQEENKEKGIMCCRPDKSAQKESCSCIIV